MQCGATIMRVLRPSACRNTPVRAIPVRCHTRVSAKPQKLTLVEDRDSPYTANMQHPNILIIAGHDPSGGAGIQADIEAVAACGGHAATVVTALTCQDTSNVHDVVATDTQFLTDCLARLAEDMSFSAIKTGVLANPAQVRAVAAFVSARPEVPLVVDPVLVAAGGGRLTEDSVGRAMLDEIIPWATLVTPNAREARALCHDEPDLSRCGMRLAADGGKVLITGGDEATPDTVINRLFDTNGEIEAYEWPRLDGVFHGSGCTLASTVAGLLGQGRAPREAVAAAQQMTWQALADGYSAGRGQKIPDRLSHRAPA